MSKKVADDIRDEGGFWKHGHTYQARLFFTESALSDFHQADYIGSSNCLRCVFGRSKGHQDG